VDALCTWVAQTVLPQQCPCRQQRHNHMNDIIWRAIKRAQIPATKKPVDVTMEDNVRPDGTTLLPWAKGRPLAWDTYATHVSHQVRQLTKQHNTREQNTPVWPARCHCDNRNMECYGCRVCAGDALLMNQRKRLSKKTIINLHCVSKTFAMFLAITRESIFGF